MRCDQEGCTDSEVMDAVDEGREALVALVLSRSSVAPAPAAVAALRRQLGALKISGLQKRAASVCSCPSSVPSLPPQSLSPLCLCVYLSEWMTLCALCREHIH